MPDHATEPIDRPAWFPPDVWPFEIRTLPTATGRIHFTDEGSGPPLVFVHAPMWSFVWRDTILRLREQFRCITLDVAGTGLSDGGRHQVDLPAAVDTVEDLLFHRDVGTATFVLHDLGGTVGMVAAARRPDRARAIVAVNTFAWPPGTPASLRRMLRIVGSGPATATVGTLRVVPRLTRTRFGVGRHLGRAERRAFLGPYRSRARARNFHRYMGEVRHHPELFEQAGRASTELSNRPLLTVFGEKSDPFGFADRWHETFDDVTSHVVKGGNHFPMCDEPDRFAALVTQWHAERVAPRRENAPAA